MLHIEPLFTNFDEIPSRKYNKSPPPFEFPPDLCRLQNPFNLNLDSEITITIWQLVNPIFIVSTSLIGETVSKTVLTHFSKDPVADIPIYPNMIKLYIISLFF